MVVVEGGVRKSVVVPTASAGEALRADMEQALRQSGVLSLSDALAAYHDYLHRVRGAVTARPICGAIRRFLGDQPSLSAITPARAAALYEAETRRVLGGSGRAVAVDSHRTILGQCRRFFAWAVESGHVAHNPFATVRPIGKPRVGKTQLRIDEARRFVAHAIDKAAHGDRIATGALLALLLGMRAGEVLGRTVRDLDDEGRVLWIPKGKTANARRRLAVPDVLRPLLLRLGQGQPPEALLFGSRAGAPGQPLSDAWLWSGIQALCKEAGVPRVSTHSLRGLHSTLALEAGATSSAVAAALGHGSFEITAKHYAAPGALDRLRSQAVQQTLLAAPPPLDLSAVPAASLIEALQRLPAPLRATLRHALEDPPPRK